jgi:hypothetical protein
VAQPPVELLTPSGRSSPRDTCFPSWLPPPFLSASWRTDRQIYGSRPRPSWRRTCRLADTRVAVVRFKGCVDESSGDGYTEAALDRIPHAAWRCTSLAQQPPPHVCSYLALLHFCHHQHCAHPHSALPDSDVNTTGGGAIEFRTDTKPPATSPAIPHAAHLHRRRSLELSAALCAAASYPACPSSTLDIQVDDSMCGASICASRCRKRPACRSARVEDKERLRTRDAYGMLTSCPALVYELQAAST